MTDQYVSYFVLIIITSLWCALHSALISVSVTRVLKKVTRSHYRYYRLFFNVFALLSLLPVLIYYYSLRTEAFFDWEGGLRILQIIFIILGVALLLLGAKKYDARRFFGIAQLNEKHSTSLNASGQLDTSGIHQLIRHPWYTALLLILWSRPLDPSTLIINTVFSVYLIIGSWLEERKLVMEFGDAYRQYQQDVSMLLPIKWIVSKLFK